MRPSTATAPAPAATARPTRPAPVREVLVLGLLFLGYRQVRYLTRDHASAALANARKVVDLERALGVFQEESLQDLVLRSQGLVELLNRYYVSVHFPLTIVFVLWVLWRHPEVYGRIRTWFILVTASALVIHVAFPLAPPRMLHDHGFVDTLQRFGPQIYSSDTAQSVANQFAAMPSLHFGWAVMVAGGFVAIERTRWSVVAAVHPIVTLVAIVATANHYWLDAAMALVLVLLGALVVARWRRRPAVAAAEVAVVVDLRDGAVAEAARSEHGVASCPASQRQEPRRAVRCVAHGAGGDRRCTPWRTSGRSRPT